MSAIQGLKSQCFKSTADVHVSIDEMFSSFTATVKLDVMIGIYFANALKEAIEIAKQLNGPQVQFEFNQILVIVRADSRSDYIYRDYNRALRGCIDGPVGPYPSSILTSEELANDARNSAKRASDSERSYVAYLASRAADVRYLDPPESGRMFRYAPMYGVDLITPDHFDHLPKGTVLTSFSGECKVKGVDYIDGDTRGGFLAYGFPTQSEDGLTYEGPYRTE